jgi:hypothetical protein
MGVDRFVMHVSDTLSFTHIIINIVVVVLSFSFNTNTHSRTHSLTHSFIQSLFASTHPHHPNMSVSESGDIAALDTVLFRFATTEDADFERAVSRVLPNVRYHDNYHLSIDLPICLSVYLHVSPNPYNQLHHHPTPNTI